jgi:hypothetical protein
MTTLLTKRELADLLGVSIRTLDRLRGRGLVAAIKLGQVARSPVRFLQEDVRRLIETFRARPLAPTEDISASS